MVISVDSLRISSSQNKAMTPPNNNTRRHGLMCVGLILFGGVTVGLSIALTSVYTRGSCSKDTKLEAGMFLI